MEDTKMPGMTDILESLQRTKDTIPGHYDTLFGERSVGSKWGFELTPDHLYGQWELVQDGPVRIYEKISEHEFTLGVMPLGALAGGDEISKEFEEQLKSHGLMRIWSRLNEKEDPADFVKVQEGDHGPELVLGPIPAEERFAETNIMTLIIGPEEGIDVVFTIHPGKATPPHGCITVEELQEKLDKGELDPNTSVKFV